MIREAVSREADSSALRRGAVGERKNKESKNKSSFVINENLFCFFFLSLLLAHLELCWYDFSQASAMTLRAPPLLNPSLTLLLQQSS